MTDWKQEAARLRKLRAMAKAQTIIKGTAARCFRISKLKAENARLTAERGWLARNVGSACPPGQFCVVDCAEILPGEKYPCPRCWTEAARRYVAGEGEPS